MLLAVVVVTAAPGAPRGEVSQTAAAASTTDPQADVPRTDVEAWLEETFDVRIEHTATDPCGRERKPGHVLGCQVNVGSENRRVAITAPDRAYETADGLHNLDQVMRHETAHALIARQCGTVYPPIAGDRAESITDVYAISYLGGDGDLFTAKSPNAPYTAGDWQAAERIHGGDCG
ncbi:hypothetical protein JCM11754A_18990 [Isoptericola variabilis]